jgi:hypothetical protein
LDGGEWSTSHPWERTLVSIEEETELAPELVWTVIEKRKLLVPTAI